MQTTIFHVGDKVRFTSESFPRKQAIARDGGLLGRPVEIAPNSIFTVTMTNEQGTPDNLDTELRLFDFPWLVYGDEVEKVL
jgi:hypothetical protein